MAVEFIFTVTDRPRLSEVFAFGFLSTSRLSKNQYQNNIEGRKAPRGSWYNPRLMSVIG